MFKIAIPVSDLFSSKAQSRVLLEYGDCLEGRDHKINIYPTKQEVFHCELQPIHQLREADFGYLNAVKRNLRNLKLITFHAATNYDRPVVKDYIFIPGGRRYSRVRLLKNARLNFVRIKKIFGKKIKIAVENNNYYQSGAYSHITNPEFISRLVHDNNINFLFDIAHAKITCINRREDYEEYKKRLPMEKAVQLHISSFAIDSCKRPYDAHRCPNAKVFREVGGLLKGGTFEYLTIEYYSNIKSLISCLKNLRALK